MYNVKETIFETVYSIVLNCGNVHEKKSFSTNVLHTISSVCPFDQARIYFYNGNGRFSDQYLIGAEKTWANAYHEYYSKILDGRYGAYSNLSESMRPLTQKINVRYWKTPEDVNNEFYQDYVRPQHIKASFGFSFFDANGSLSVMFTLDRLIRTHFSDYEIELLQLTYPQLNNLYKNFFGKSANKYENINWNTTSLTPREIDIATLLCQGVSPSNISHKLHIALSTVNKHIAHIYAKMQVSNRQELLVRVLNF